MTTPPFSWLAALAVLAALAALAALAVLSISAALVIFKTANWRQDRQPFENWRP